MSCKVITHRGANKFAPQNTIPAFKKALEIGTNGFETDVHCTKDGKIVVCHNYTVDETSNGNGNISDMTFDELRSLDFGSYFSEDFKGVQIPTLDEFLDCCVSDDIEVMNIEIKSPKNGDVSIADKTIAAVKNKGLFDKLLISSFDPAVLKRCKEVDSNCKTGFLYSPNNKTYYKTMFISPVKFLKSIKCNYAHPHYSLVSKHFVKILHHNGIGINPWTVDTEKASLRMLKYGCDGIITNCPDVVNKVIAEFEK